MTAGLFRNYLCACNCVVTLQEKEVQRRNERDRANIAEQQVKQLNESVALKDRQIAELTEKGKDGVTLLQREQEAHNKTREALTAARLEIEALQQQLRDQKSSASTVQQKLESLEKLAQEFEALSGEAEANEKDMQAWHDSVEERRAKAMAILESAERSALAVLSQLDQGAADALAVNELAQQVRLLTYGI